MLYGPRTDAAKRVRELLDAAGGSSQAMGDRIIRQLIELLYDSAWRLPDGRVAVQRGGEKAFVASFAFKTMDHLAGTRLLLHIGALGPATVEARVLLEILINLTYILEKDTSRRMREYRAWQLREELKTLRGLIDTGRDRSPRTKELLTLTSDALRACSGDLPKERRWTGSDTATLASNLGLGVLYSALYRSASRVAHGGDVDSYNPLFPVVAIENPEQVAVPIFSIHYGFWGLNDIMSLISVLDTVPLQVFGKVASFLGLPLTDLERERVDLARKKLFDTEAVLMSTSDFAKAYPELFPFLREKQTGA